MQSKMPVLACTDPNTDIGKVITDGGFGWWWESNSTADFTATVDSIINADLTAMGDKGYEYLLDNYTSEIGYNILIKNYNRWFYDQRYNSFV
jgi:hypothetical protein